MSSPDSLPPDIPTNGPSGEIQFHSEGIAFRLRHIRRMRDWMRSVAREKGRTLLALNVIFCDDDFLHDVNLRYLQHDTLTDIITFPYSQDIDIQGDIFISVERVRENASQFEASFQEELRRVIIHGVLHLCGLGDKSPEEQKEMREAEDRALAQWKATA